MKKDKERKRLKVMLHPDEVVSKYDGDRHFIGGAKLARLYGVLPTDDVVTYDMENPTHSVEWENNHPEMRRIHLYPLRSGEYYDLHEYDDIEVKELLKLIKA